jgi:hypothetical protein
MALDAIFALRQLSDWERQFARSIRELIDSRAHARVSEKQEAVLDRLLVRVWNEERQAEDFR